MSEKTTKFRIPFITSYYELLLGIFRKPDIARAVLVWSILFFPMMLGALFLLAYMFILYRDTPSLTQIENPDLSYASVAYTSDGVELARFGRQNRTWIAYDSISVYARDALISTEDHRFYSHWGMDLFRTISAASQTLLGKIGLPFARQGGSTITQQLARNLYNEQIGFDVSIERKLKEMVTAVRLEHSYAKNEIAEMYLNTIPFLYNAYGIEAASRTYFNKSAAELNLLEGATLIGLLKGTTRYDPVRNPERSMNRRNTVLRQMIARDKLDKEVYESVKDSLTITTLRTSDVTESIAPYFAEQVRQWVTKWGNENGINIYSSPLTIQTTLDSRLQSIAETASTSTLNGLQAVVNCEWSAPQSPRLQFGEQLNLYLSDSCHQNSENHWKWFWNRNSSIINSFITESSRFQNLINQGHNHSDALNELRNNSEFLDSLKATKSRIETGFVAMDPTNGYLKVWIGGRDLSTDWYDHVGIAKRQAGSVFKPFTYAWAIDSGYSPEALYIDSVFSYVDKSTGDIWSPENFNDQSTGEMIPMRDGLSRSLNTITAQIIEDINPVNVAKLANWMGIKSELNPVRSLSLGTSDVSLLEVVNAYSTFANRGIHTDPVMVTRILNESGQVLYEYQPVKKEVLSEETTAIMIDMLRDVINKPYGTGIRIRSRYGQMGYDFAGKTGTTQEGADGWFILMHPELVTGAWVGFNDRRMTFRSTWWGQGAHNALFVVGEFLEELNQDDEIKMSLNVTFPPPPLPPPTSDDRVEW